MKFGPRFQSRNAASLLRKIVFVCRGCCLQHVQAKAPAQCLHCGRMDFDRFDSRSEANRWAQLLFLEKLSKVSKVRRQVRVDLLAYHDGKPIKVAVYVADFVYERDGKLIYEDNKPARGIDDLARLKLKWLEAMGYNITVTST